MLNLRRNWKPLIWFRSQLNRNRTVTTWSHLANHFNSKPEGDRWSFLKNEHTVSEKQLSFDCSKMANLPFESTCTGSVRFRRAEIS